MTDEDREFVREMMEESKSGPLLMRPVDWIVVSVNTFFTISANVSSPIAPP